MFLAGLFDLGAMFLVISFNNILGRRNLQVITCLFFPIHALTRFDTFITILFKLKDSTLLAQQNLCHNVFFSLKMAFEMFLCCFQRRNKDIIVTLNKK